MVNMNKRYNDDSEDEGSDDDGNFKRSRRHHPSDNESTHQTQNNINFVSNTIQSFAAPEVSQPTLRVVHTPQEQQLIQRQRVLNEKLSKLPKYDDLCDNSSEDCMQSNAVNRCDELPTDSAVDSGVSLKVKTNGDSSLEVLPEPIDVLAGGDTKEVSKPKTIDPRLRRLERFKDAPPQEPVLKMEPKIQGQALLRKVNDLLTARKPYEAYYTLKAQVSALEVHKYTDLLMVMADDWFESQIAAASDPRSVFIEMQNLNSFSNLMRDIFSIKVKSQKFWESVILKIQKFVDDSKIRFLPQMITKLRWIVVKDIRDYLVNEEVKINLRTSAILLDHKLKLEYNRDRHRRNFEATVEAHMAKLNQQMEVDVPVQVSTRVEPPPVPVIISRPIPSIPQKVSEPKDTIFDDQIINPFESSTMQSIGDQPNDRRTTNQILECLTNDQFFKLIQMMDRHTRNQSLTFIDNFGQAMKLFVEKHQKFSVFTIYQKLHDSIILNINDFRPGGRDDNRLNIIVEKLLTQFYETVIYNPKEYLLIRDHTRQEKFNQHFTLKENPFNEPLFPILHNIVVDCGYISEGLIVNYTAFEQEIPLIAKNIILKDPRMELRSEALVSSLEVIDLDESVVGMFSPERSDGSPSNSPEYTFSGISPPSDSNSEVNSDSNCEDMPNMSPEYPSAVEEPNLLATAETTVQITENANPVPKVLTSKPKIVKKGLKKVIPLKNKLNNKTNSNKIIPKKKVIKEIPKQNLRTSPGKPQNAAKPLAKPQSASISQNVIKTNAKPFVSPVVRNESPVKPQSSSVSATISPNSKNLTNCSTVVNNNPLNSTTDANETDVPQKRIIKLSKSPYNEAELKKIIRRVSISSDESESE